MRLRLGNGLLALLACDSYSVCGSRRNSGDEQTRWAIPHPDLHCTGRGGARLNVLGDLSA